MKREYKDFIKGIASAILIIAIIGIAGTFDRTDAVVQSMGYEEYDRLYNQIGDHGILTDYYIVKAYESDKQRH